MLFTQPLASRQGLFTRLNENSRLWDCFGYYEQSREACFDEMIQVANAEAADDIKSQLIVRLYLRLIRFLEYADTCHDHTKSIMERDSMFRPVDPLYAKWGYRWDRWLAKNPSWSSDNLPLNIDEDGEEIWEVRDGLEPWF